MIIDSRKIKSADRLSEQSDVFEYGYKKDAKMIQNIYKIYTKKLQKKREKAEIM